MKKGMITGEYGYSIDIDMTFDEVDPEEFDMLILPGGKAPEKVRLKKRLLILHDIFSRRINQWERYVTASRHLFQQE